MLDGEASRGPPGIDPAHLPHGDASKDRDLDIASPERIRVATQIAAANQAPRGSSVRYEHPALAGEE